MVIAAERVKQRQAKAEKEAEKMRIRATKEAEREQKRKEREAVEAEREVKRKEKEARREKEEAKKQAVEAEKEVKRREKEAAEAEREQKRKERELKKQQEESEKEVKRKEREVKRQQDEAEREQKRKEKEAAERKKQLVLQKQANIMDRLFSRPQGKQSSGPSPPDAEQLQVVEIEPSSAAAHVVSQVDEELRSTCVRSEEEILRSHVVSWQEKRKCRSSSEPFRRWGMRLAPKVSVVPELRLQGASMRRCSNSGAQTPSLKRKREEDSSLDDKLEDDIVMLEDDDDDDDNEAEEISCPARKKQCNARWKLLQFDKSYRPAYYGTFSKVSATVGPRHPLRKDPSLVYEVDSDEEWEEEDPGESLSDCEDNKEDEVEKVSEVESDEDAAEGFVVPDGYLSEDEGVHVGGSDVEHGHQTSRESPLAGESNADENVASMDQTIRRQQQLLKVLDDVTKHALKRNRPFLASNLPHEPGEKCAGVENRTERLCFEALRMCVVAPDIAVGPAPDVSVSPAPSDSPLPVQERSSQKTPSKIVQQKIRTVQQKTRVTAEVVAQ